MKEIKKESYISIYTDGACHPNPGTGGYAFVVIENEKLISEFYTNVIEKTTNQRMELMAILAALRHIQLNYPTDNIIIYSDSEYGVNGTNQWIHDWTPRRWQTIQNSDLWKEIAILAKQFTNVKYVWIKGHSGNKWNEYADKLANSAITGRKNE